jgi:F-type H+-transporting ATPase subunit gamma
MPNLKEVRIRIESVKSTQQITSAMKMVAASKLRKAQNAIIALRPYANKLKEILGNLSNSLEENGNNLYGEIRREEKILIVSLASNRGLCGAFNTNVIKATKLLLDKNYNRQYTSGNVRLICAGRHVTDFFSKKGFPVIDRKDALLEKVTFAGVSEFAEQLMAMFARKEFDKVLLVYNQFKNAAVQRLVTEQFLPVMPPEVKGNNVNRNADYIFEPGREEILEELIPKTLKIQLYKAFLDSYASEQGARMTAMHQATDNASEMLKQLKLSYNKARQTAITTEILEIVSGANALKA